VLIVEGGWSELLTVTIDGRSITSGDCFHHQETSIPPFAPISISSLHRHSIHLTPLLRSQTTHPHHHVRKRRQEDDPAAPFAVREQPQQRFRPLVASKDLATQATRSRPQLFHISPTPRPRPRSPRDWRLRLHPPKRPRVFHTLLPTTPTLLLITSQPMGLS
jgi:hypothetical protein